MRILASSSFSSSSSSSNPASFEEENENEDEDEPEASPAFKHTRRKRGGKFGMAEIEMAAAEHEVYAVRYEDVPGGDDARNS